MQQGPLAGADRYRLADRDDLERAQHAELGGRPGHPAARVSRGRQARYPVMPDTMTRRAGRRESPAAGSGTPRGRRWWPRATLRRLRADRARRRPGARDLPRRRAQCFELVRREVPGGQDQQHLAASPAISWTARARRPGWRPDAARPACPRTLRVAGGGSGQAANAAARVAAAAADSRLLRPRSARASARCPDVTASARAIAAASSRRTCWLGLARAGRRRAAAQRRMALSAGPLASAASRRARSRSSRVPVPAGRATAALPVASHLLITSRRSAASRPARKCQLSDPRVTGDDMTSHNPAAVHVGGADPAAEQRHGGGYPVVPAVGPATAPSAAAWRPGSPIGIGG